MQRDLIRNWFVEEDDNRIELMKSLLSNYNNVEVNLADHSSQLPHSRELTLEFENGKVLILRLDQGLGYWKVNRAPNYPFDKTIEEQLAWINEKANHLETVNLQRHPTYIDITIDN
jgi:DEAD/DEAH box helicase domain-containing protein